MAQPRDYTRQYNFNDFQTTSPSDPLPGTQVDNELNAVKLTLDDLNENIEKIQRDDGKLKNQAVHKDAFDAGALALVNAESFNPRGDWTAGRAYAVNDIIDFNGATYLATVAHTSAAAFATDLDADRWVLLANAAIATTAAAVDKYEGDGSQTVFTLQYNYAADTSAMVFVNGALRNPGDDYTISGNTLTFVTAPSTPSVAGNENVIVFGASVVAQAAKEAAEAARDNSESYRDTSQDWASKTTGDVDSSGEYSSKAYAIGGTGVDAGSGSAKDWATKTNGTVGNTGEYSAKYYATDANVGTVATNITDVNTVAGEISPTNNISTVAARDADIGTVASRDTDIGTVAARDADIGTVAARDADIGTVAARDADIGTVAARDADVGTVATDSADIQTLAAISTDITSLANSLGAVTTYTVTVAQSNGVNVFYIDGAANPVLTFDRGNTYIFDLSDSSNSNHPLAFKDGSNSYTTGVTTTGTAGSAGAQVQIDVDNSAPSPLRYYCTVHGNAMGNTINVVNSNLALVASNITNVNNVGNDITNVNLVAGSITNVDTVATNLTDVNAFAETYFIGATQPANPTNGDLWFDTSSDTMKVYGTSGFQNAGSSVNGTTNRYQYLVGTTSGSYTGSTTVFPATYDSGYVDVYRNGIKLVAGASNDFTATNGTSITLSSAATTGDTIDIVGYGTFTLNATTLDDLDGVSVASPSSGQFLKYDGNNWVGDSVPSSDLVNDTTPQLGGNLDTNGNEISIPGAAGSNGVIKKNQSTGRDEIQIYSGGDAYQANSNGAGIHLYGNSDSEHDGNFAVLTGPDNNGDARLIVSGREDKAHITLGNSIWDYVDDGLDPAVLNIRNPSSQPALLIESADNTEGGIVVPDGEDLYFGHWNKTTSTFTNRMTLASSGALVTDRIDFNTSRNVRIISGGNSELFGTTMDDGGIQIQVDTVVEIVEADDVNQRVFVADGNSGCIRHPTQPCFTATMASNVAWGNSSAFAFNQTNVNNGNHFNTGNYRFTAPVNGIYYFAVNLSIAAGSTGSDDTMYWGFYKNGSQETLTKDNWRWRGGGAGTGVEFTSTISAFIQLSANDYVTVGATGISDTTGLVQGSGYSMFSGHLVA